jgi:hypothetical protein
MANEILSWPQCLNVHSSTAASMQSYVTMALRKCTFTAFAGYQITFQGAIKMVRNLAQCKMGLKTFPGEK